MIDAIILAGGKNSKTFSEFAKQPYEAMIELNGRPMVTFVAEALALSSQVDKIFVLGPVRELQKCIFPMNTVVLEAGSTILETIKLGIDKLQHTRQVLIATADIPLITTEAINHFIAECLKTKADLYYPVVEKKVCQEKYPSCKRTYVRLREGTFTGGNIFLVNPAIVSDCLITAEKIIDYRKSPLKLCTLLGLGFLVKFICGLLTIDMAQEQVSGLLGIKGVVLQSPYPEIGIDVDKQSDLELAQTAIALRA